MKPWRWSKAQNNPTPPLENTWPGCILRVMEGDLIVRYRVEHLDTHLALVEGDILDESGEPTSRFVMSFAKWRKLAKKT